MLKLFQREECPACTRVRQVMAQHHLSFETVYVTRLGSQRAELRKLTGQDSPEVPLLVDGDRVIQGSEEIIDHLKAHHAPNDFGDPTYGLTRVLKNVSFADAVGATKKALAEEGFGVLTEIDIRQTLNQKLGVPFANYVILGACNPKLAHQGLEVEPGLGLLLPCNVVVTEDREQNAIVSAVDPRQMFKVVGQPGLEEIAGQVRTKLARALSSIAAP